MRSTIIYTKTDEAPALATRSLLPIVRAFTACAEIVIEEKDISLASRILAAFSDRLSSDQQRANALAEPGKVVKVHKRGSHFYLALYWARALRVQSEDLQLRSRFSALHAQFLDEETTILNELNATQGRAVDIGGYYDPDDEKADQSMRPSSTFNRLCDSASSK